MSTEVGQGEGSLRDEQPEARPDGLDAVWESFDGSPVGTAVTDDTGRILRVNGPLASVLGRPVDGLCRSRIVDLVHPDELDELGAARGSLPPGSREMRWTRQDGTVVWCSTDVWTVRRAEGGPPDPAGPPLTVNQVRDVSARRAAEAALQASEIRLRNLIEGVEEYAIYQLDPEGLVASWNTGAERIKGYRPDEILGRHYRMFFTPEEVAAGVPEKNLVLAAGQGRTSGEGWRVRRDGEAFWASWTTTALYDGDRLVGFSKITRDMSAQREAQLRLLEYTQKLQEANRSLEEASRMQEDILAVAHHELRTPLTMVIGFAQTLLQSWDRLDDERRQASLRAIESGGRRLQGLVENLLALSSLHSATGSLASETVSLRRAVVDAGEGAGVSDVAVDVPADLLVQGDPVRIRQMVANLLTNASTYGARPIEVRARPEGDMARLEVADRGPGVAPEFVPHLFERFSQASRGTTRTSRGTGLGLASVLELARAQGGDAFYEENRPNGARFVVVLPRVPDPTGTS